MSELASTATQMRNRETVRRSFLKAISWRVVGTLDTFILSYILIMFLGPLLGMSADPLVSDVAQTAGLIAITEVVTKLIIYTIHEQIWTRIPWGLSVLSHERPESFARSTVKTATWRVLASLDTMLLAWFFTGNILTALSIGGLEVITKLILYFLHERAWLRITFGLQKIEV